MLSFHPAKVIPNKQMAFRIESKAPICSHASANKREQNLLKLKTANSDTPTHAATLGHQTKVPDISYVSVGRLLNPGRDAITASQILGIIFLPKETTRRCFCWNWPVSPTMHSTLTCINW